MSAKFSPGPWRWEYDWTAELVDAQGTTVAKTLGVSSADARLIAAAPEMYELLEVAWIFMETHGPDLCHEQKAIEALLARIDGKEAT